jgi:hypothetical protein
MNGLDEIVARDPGAGIDDLIVNDRGFSSR